MNTTKNAKIPGLYKLKKSDREKICLTYLDAFRDYPKLMSAFPNERERLFALEATLRYYTAYDMAYGAAFSLDKNIHEAAMLVHSDEMNYTLLRHFMAGSYDGKYRKIMKLLSRKDRRLRTMLFEEMDRLEAQIDIPYPHIYLDFLGVATQYQKQGRGYLLMKKVCAYADHLHLPVMLFTNTAQDIRFYCSLGFKIIGETYSDKYGFINTYLVYGIK